MKERLGSQAFNIEYEPQALDIELRDDVVSYLGEYRFQLDKFRYRLNFSGNSKTTMCLRDARRGEPMKTKILRAIEERKKLRLPTEREEVELVGIEHLDDQLRFVQSAGTILWASPKGPKEQGYGDYGFLFLGQVKRMQELHADVSMVAIRVENPTLERFNSALSMLLGRDIVFESAEDFLKSPWVVSAQISESAVDAVLKKVFPKKNGETQEGQFEQIVKELDPLINDFICLTKYGSKEEKLRAFYTLENYALALKKIQSFGSYKAVHLDELIPYYSHKPPAVAGSCGSTGEISSNNILNKFNALHKALFGESEWFKCPKCDYQADGPVGNKCPSCGLTKEEYVKESKKPVCA